MTSVEEFYTELFQDVSTTAAVDGMYLEDVFFDIVTSQLVDAGEFDDVERAYFKPAQGGIRVDGFCGDPLESAFDRDAGQEIDRLFEVNEVKFSLKIPLP